MKYIVSEEELVRFKNMSVYFMTKKDTVSSATKRVVDEFLKSKQPVELVAEGLVGYCFNGYTLDEKLISNMLYKVVDKHLHKNIKIYVEVIK